MAQYTPNFNLYEPDSSDDFADFRTEFNNNMNIIDQNLGGGSGGHTIYDKDGNALAQESGLQFTGNVNVSDDNVNGRTVVDILGGGGVYGLFIDTSKVIASATVPSDSTATYTATEDCYFVGGYYGNADDGRIEIDGEIVSLLYVVNNSAMLNYVTVPVRKGQVVTIKTKQYNGTYTVYGTINGSNPIFAPIIYSDTERVIGVWRDNKPLYQRTIYIPSLPNATEVSYPHNISNLDKVVEIFGIAYNSSGYSIPIIFANPTYVSQVTAYTSATDIYIGTGMDRTSFVGYITLRYTKTTDVAGSGNWNTDGVPTVHYSTSEQVIGTWIDGKPLYEITVEVNSVNYNDWTDVFYLADADIKGYDSRTSYAQLNNGERVQLDWFVTTSIYNRSIITNSGTKFRVETQGNNYSKIVATIQYTKTTD